MAMLNNQMVILMGKLGFEQYDFWVPDFKQTDRYVTNNPGNSAKCFLTCGHHKNFATGGALQRNPNEQLEIHVYTMYMHVRTCSAWLALDGARHHVGQNAQQEAPVLTPEPEKNVVVPIAEK